jgi:hypothetical protein
MFSAMDRPLEIASDNVAQLFWLPSSVGGYLGDEITHSSETLGKIGRIAFQKEAVQWDGLEQALKPYL